MPLTPHLSRIEFAGGDRVHFQPGSVFVAVGPNNAGKSHFLAQLRAKLLGASMNGLDPREGLITEVRFNWSADERAVGDHLEKLALTNWQILANGYSTQLPPGETDLTSYVNHEDIRRIASQDSTFQQFLELFVRWDEPISRILESEWQEPKPRGGASLHLARQDAPLEKVSSLFGSIFKQPISVYDKREGRIGFLLGRPEFDGPSLMKAPDKRTLEFMDGAPKMHDQGMGMRNVFGLLARFLTDNRSIVLMDEPEAFLHPPQAAELGELLGHLCQESGKQLICATHDRSFLAGLARGAANHLRVRRFDYKLENSSPTPVFTSQEVNQNPWKTIRNKSRVRYSNVLDALFSRRVILVESERDALFYHEALDFLAQNDSNLDLHADDYLFLPVGGNAEFAPMITLMRELSTPVLVIGDLDLVADENRLAATAAAAGVSDLERVTKRQRRLYKFFETQYDNRPENSELKAMANLESALDSPDSGANQDLFNAADRLLRQLKERQKHNRKNKINSLMSDRLGSVAHDSPESRLKDEILCLLRTCGIFLLPTGELEDFDRELLRKVGKSEWVAEAIARGTHKEDLAQSFIRSVVSEKQIDHL